MLFAREQLELQQRRERLRLRSTELRATLAERARALEPPLALADQVRSGVAWLRAHPEWPLGALAVLVVLHPRRALRWGARAWWGWRLWRHAQRLLRAAVEPR
ncbi:YqjK-like family protein [Azohydromonas sediminis]|uniref:YqjK-like family protein n=1 Tax=Azohydromonas sediminis TaxID=2259674 RepID=UPI000E64E51D|nr:YqjK-like family protein [Azohydromonas sediminis]